MIVMDEGVIVAEGNTKEILADAKFLEAHGLVGEAVM
jgi:ABC-type antimicrobial peptide transport system ATPase subunit